MIDHHLDDICRNIKSFSRNHKEMLFMGYVNGRISVEHVILSAYNPKCYHPDDTDVEASCTSREFAAQIMAHLNLVIGDLWFNNTVKIMKSDTSGADLYDVVKDFTDRSKAFSKLYYDT